MGYLEVLKEIVGYGYFVAWSLSVYGMVYEIWKLKSSRGAAGDYQMYALQGYIAYTVYNLWAYFDPRIDIVIGLNDILFSIHGGLVTSFIFMQMYIIYYEKEHPAEPVSKFVWGVTLLFWWGVFNVAIIEQVLGLYDYAFATAEYAFSMLIYLSYIKVVAATLKYIPQLVFNWRRKSTKGWSIHSMILDFIGGLFSLIEVVLIYLIESEKGEDNSTLNYGKILLSVASMAFDLMFVVQHYFLYPGKEPLDLENSNSQSNN